MPRPLPVLWLLVLAAVAPALAEVRLTGRITNETAQPVGGARIVVESPSFKATAVSDPTGAFTIAVGPPGTYKLDVDREGYFRYINADVDVSGTGREIHVVLNTVHEVRESVNVAGTPGVVDMDRTSPQNTISGTKLLDIPYPTNNNLRTAMRLIPGMVQDNRGGIHLHGGDENQTLYTLEGFQINDPLTGRLETRTSVESVQSIDVTAARPAAEFGKAAAGTMAIHTRTGADQWRYSATNFIPAVEHQKGFDIGGWTPRAYVSGPWKKGRAWFSDSIDTQYSLTVVPELPAGQDRTSAWRLSNLIHNQINLTPSNILYSGFLVNYFYAPRSGLTALDPRETTLDRRSRQWFTYLKDQKYFSRGALIEFGFAANRTFAREIPQGTRSYFITPGGNSGNNFRDATQKAGRDQWLANGFLPSLTFWGGHQIKTGVDLDRLTYFQAAHRSGVEYTLADLSPIRRLDFVGSGRVQRSSFEAATYLQDSWRVRPNLLLEIGLRSDWDRILRNWNVSPRVGFAWSPFGLENTRISGGFARIFDTSSLSIFTRPDDQYAVSTYFDPGGEIARGPVLSIFRIDNLHLPNPRYTNWNLGLEQQLPHHLQVRVNALRRRGVRGLTYVNSLGPLPQPNYDAIYDLTNSRWDYYDAAEIAIRQPIRRQYEWMVSYTRSRARSTAVVDQTVDNPLLIPSNAGRLPWDAPNRLLSWGFLPTPWKDWSVAYLMEYRSGFPFAVQSAYGQVVGPLDGHQFHDFFELDLHLERRFTFRTYRWAFRFGVNNITGHKNANVVNNVIGAPNYLSLYGGQSRAVNFRVRWLGRP